MPNVKNGQSAIMPKTHTIIKGLDIYTQVPKDRNGIPVIRRCTRIPQGLVSFTEIGGKVIPEGHAVHFFLHDQKFECVWQQPNRYLNVLSKQKFLLSPDFSAFMDMPEDMLYNNVLRSKILGSWWQMNGNEVIPTVTWAGVGSYDKCFAGIESGGVVAVGPCPIRNKGAANLWHAGYEAMCERLRPICIVIYGCGKTPDISCDAQVVTFPNQYIERMRRCSNGR